MAQIIANGSKGHHKFTLEVIENSTSIENNTSTLSFTFKLSPIQKGWDWSGWGSQIAYEIKIDDNTYTGTIPKYDGSSTITLKSEENISITHNNDGTKSINISFKVTDGTGQSYTPGNASQSSTMELTTIPRATACPNLDGYIESSIAIALSPASSNFKHRLYYSYNGKTGYYPNSTGFFSNVGNLSLDTSFYSYTPKSIGTGTLTLYTYNSDGTLIGSTSGNITIRCDKEKCKPTITATIIDINETTKALTGDNTKLVKGYSKAQITYTITTRNGASLSSKKINGSTLGTSPYVINNISTNIFDIMAVDSRGFDTTIRKTNTIINYIPLTLDFNAFRPTPTGSEIRVNFQGNYFNGSFGSVNNTLTLSWKYRIKGTDSWIDGGTFVKDSDYEINGNRFNSKGDVSLSTTIFEYQNNYEIAIYYADKLINTSTSKPVPKGKPVLNWEDDLVNVNGEFTINEKNIKSNFVAVSSTEPTIGEEVWMQKGKNLFCEVNPILGYYDNSGNWTDAAAITTYGPFYIKGTIYVSATVNGSAICRLSEFKKDGTFIKRTLIMNSALTLDSNTDYIVISNDTNENENKYFTNFMITSGNTAQAYEEYKDNKIYTKDSNGNYNLFMEEGVTVSATEPSANRGRIWIQSSKNIINPYNKHSTSATYTFTGDTYKQTGSGSVFLLCTVVVGETYTLSYKNNNGFASIRASDYNYGGSWLEYGRATTTNGTVTFTAKTDTVVIALVGGTANSSTVQKVQLELGSTATDYEASVENKLYTKNDNNVYDELLNVERANNQLNYSETEKVIGTWISGVPIYRRVVNCGTLTNASTKYITHNIANVKYIVGIKGFAYNSAGDTLPLPHANTTPTSSIYVYAGRERIEIGNGTDRSGFNAFVILDYIKTTD